MSDSQPGASPQGQQNEGEPAAKKPRVESSDCGETVPISTPMSAATVSVPVTVMPAPTAGPQPPPVSTPIAVAVPAQATVAVPVQPQAGIPVVTSSAHNITGVAPVVNTFPGGINLTISNGSINIKPASSNVPVGKTEGPGVVIQGAPSVVKAPIGHVSGGNVTIRAPIVQQQTGGPINVRLPGVINTSLINPLLGKTQAVTLAPGSLPVGVTTSPLPLQQPQLTNIRLQQVPTIMANPGIQRQNVSSAGILGAAAGAAGIQTLPVGVEQSQVGGMAPSKMIMGKALGLTLVKAGENRTESPRASPSQSTSKIDATKNETTSNGEQKTEAKTECEKVKEEPKDDATSSADGTATPMEEDNKGDFDALDALTWDNGVGTLPGSDLKFRMNEFGIMELIDEQDTNDSAATEPCTPEADQESSETSDSPETVADEKPKADEFVRCIQCGTYGMAADFFKAGPVERFCSQACHQSHKAACKAAASQKTSFGKKTIKDLAVIRYKKKKLMVDDMSQGGAVRGRPRVRTMEPEDAEDVEVAKTMASAKKTKGFSWNTYLQQERATRPPNKLFRSQPVLPANRNGFKVGMKLEGIDPRHPSLYCVLSVAEVRGYRIRLHFDGYSECHDFWVNASSVDIFPVGWCEKNNKKLQVPKGFSPDTFSWQSYLKLSKAQAAPRNLFQSQQAASVTPHGFRVGMKLEAIDKKNAVLICVATVTDIIGDRILIHFDGWEDIYDYWADPTSPYIKPVGYCQETEKALSPPKTCEDIENFTWERYLKQTKSQPVPARAFKQRAPHQFEIHHKLEVVDKRNPILVRVATIVNIEEYRIKIHFDGWSDIFDDWLDDDCPDFHPPGWCAKTGHPLQPPISPQDLVVSPSQGGCPTPGCKGIGHIKGAKYTGHHSAFGCPYSTVNMNKGNTVQDRLGGAKDDISPPSKLATLEAKSSPLAEKRFHSGGKYKDMVNGDNAYKSRVGPGRPGRKKHKFLTRMKEPKDEEDEDDQENYLHNGIHQSVFMSALAPNPVKDFPLCWEQHSKLLPGVGKIRGAVVAKWTIDEVSTFVQSLPGCDEQGKIFQDEQIDGEAFLLLNQTDIVKIMNIKLGPALKIYNSILMFKNTCTAES